MIREEEFSPLKNAPGAEKDTPEMAKAALCNLHYQYILNAGGKFVDDNGEVLPDIPRYSTHGKTHALLQRSTALISGLFVIM